LFSVCAFAGAGAVLDGVAVKLLLFSTDFSNCFLKAAASSSVLNLASSNSVLASLSEKSVAVQLNCLGESSFIVIPAPSR